MTHCPRPQCSQHLYVDGTCPTHGEPPTVLPADVVAELTGERATKQPHQHWTAEHRARLLALATRERSGTDIARELTAEFGTARTLKSVKHQLERLGVSKPRVHGQKRATRKRLAPMTPRSRWTAPEVAAIEDGERTEVGILVRARGEKAVINKAYRMGAPLRSSDGCMSVRQVSERWKVRHPSLLGWIDRGLLPATKNGDLWRIDPGDAERLVPKLKREAARNAGRKAWWKS